MGKPKQTGNFTENEIKEKKHLFKKMQVLSFQTGALLCFYR